MDEQIINDIKKYYTEKIVTHGSNFSGVDWNSKESQYLRFEQLCKVIKPEANFSVLDYGCGYGELVNFLNNEFKLSKIEYTGYDISDAMLDKAKLIFIESPNIKFDNILMPGKWDYSIESGTFNVKPQFVLDKQWLTYILDTLDFLANKTEKGFAFNMLTKFSDPEFKKEHLYYADPMFFFNYCKENFSKNVALLHDYDLYEFTIIVRK